MQPFHPDNQSPSPEHTDILSLQFAVNAAGIGIWDLKLTDPWTVVWDERCRELSGAGAGDSVTYEDTFQLIHPADRAMVDAAVKSALSAGKDVNHDITYRTIGISDQKLRWIRSLGRVFVGETGKPYRFSGILMDSTEKMLADQKAIAAENLTREAIRGSGVGLFHIDLATDSIDYMPAFAVILTGESNTQLTRADFLRHVHPDDLELRSQAVEQGIESGDLYYEARTIWKDGSVRWIRTVGTVMSDASGKPLLISGTVQDITAHKEKELALKAAEDQFRTIVEQAPVAIALFSTREMVIDQANQTILDFWGKKEDVIGKSLQQALPELVDQPFIELMQEVYDTGIARHFHNMPAKLVHDGYLEENFYDFVYTPTRTPDGIVNGIMLVATDVTVQVKARQELETSQNQLKSLIESAPFPIGVYTGREMRIQFANQSIIDVWAKGNEVIGKRYAEILPELSNQAIFEQLDQVYRCALPKPAPAGRY